MPDINPPLGQKINLAEAQELIQEYDFLKTKVEFKVKEGVTQPAEVSKASVFINREYNAFVFTKDLIMRFFDGSEQDGDGNPQASNYLVVILGAHKDAKTVNDQNFEAGSFTVLTAGCTKKTEQKDGKETVKFYPLNTPLPANEYPPRTVITLKPAGENKIEGNGFEYFEVI